MLLQTTAHSFYVQEEVYCKASRDVYVRIRIALIKKTVQKGNSFKKPKAAMSSRNCSLLCCAHLSFIYTVFQYLSVHGCGGILICYL